MAFRDYLPGSDGDLRRPLRTVPGDPRLVDSSGMIGPLKWRMSLSDTAIQAELMLKDKAAPVGRCIGYCEIKIDPLHLTSGRRSPDSVNELEDDW